MGQKEKLIKRLKSKPKDFTFDDAETLLNYLGSFKLFGLFPLKQRQDERFKDYIYK